jgi:hypothetical protein
MHDPLSEARIRGQRYWYRDGLEEIFLGCVCMLQGGWLLFNHFVSSKSSWYLPGALICFLVIAGFPIARIKASMRERFTYPRSGYVDPGASVRKHRIRLGAALLFLVIGTGAVAIRNNAFGAWDLNRGIQWLPAIGGVIIGAVSVYVWVSQGLPRFLVLAVFAIILGAAVSLEYPLKLGTAIWLIGVGCAWICSGGLTLWNFVRTAPPSAAET